MPSVLTKKPTTVPEIIDAIIALGSDKNKRVCADDEIEWLETKLREVARLGRILKNKRLVPVVNIGKRKVKLIGVDGE